MEIEITIQELIKQLKQFDLDSDVTFTYSEDGVCSRECIVSSIYDDDDNGGGIVIGIKPE